MQRRSVEGTPQNGFVVLLMLMMLLTGGATAMTQIAEQRLSHTAPAPGFAQAELQAARQALLSYSTLYAYRYGPRGAGPGHLPCPDTDVNRDGRSDSAQHFSRTTSMDYSDDGPNPPCASSRYTSGKLPRHITFPAQRYVFHGETGQRFDYTVSDAVINNPVNRVVNDSALMEDATASPFIAWIEAQDVKRVNKGVDTVRVPISRTALLQAVNQGVAHWFLTRSNRPVKQVDVCKALSEEALGFSDKDLNMSIAAEGMVSNRRMAVNLDSASSAIDGRVRANSIYSVSGNVDRNRDADAHIAEPGKHDLTLLLGLLVDDRHTEVASCNGADSDKRQSQDKRNDTEVDSPTLQNSVIEQVPAAMHWFFRNAWHERVTLQVSELCSMNESAACRWEPAIMGSEFSERETDTLSESAGLSFEFRVAR